MAVDRPSYHESWYRVAGVKPRLRSIVQTHRQVVRGQVWYVLRDPVGHKFFRVTEPAYRLVGLLDGRRTLEEAWAHTQQQLGERAPTQGEAIQIIGQLYSSNLLRADWPGDAETMMRRYRKRRGREVRQTLQQLLFARIPLLDPDRFLGYWRPLVGWAFGPVGLALWFAMLAFAFVQIGGQWRGLFDQATAVLRPDNLILLFVATVLSKLVHEMGHGFACKRFGQRQADGAEVHTLGVMLVALIPMPYIDATSSWAFPNKWHRAMVAAAGMYTELALAAAAAVVWANVAEGTMLSAFCVNLVFIASVSTLLFNANPLIKFDGYYILSDLTETPNLQMRSMQLLQFGWKSLVMGVRRLIPPNVTGPVEGTGLTVYGITSLIYKVILIAGIILFVAEQYLLLGVLMAIFGVVGFAVVPVFKLLKYLASSPELARHRSRAWITTLGVLALIAGSVGWINAPEGVRAQAVVEPERIAVIRAEVAATVQQGLRDPGAVQSGDWLAGLANPRLTWESHRLDAALVEAQAQRRLAETEDPAMAMALDRRIASLLREQQQNREDRAALRIAAPLPGRWVPGDAIRRDGQPLRVGDELGVVYDPESTVIRVVADQWNGPRLTDRVRVGDRVEFRVPGQATVVRTGTVLRLIPAGRRELPSAALGFLGGGDLAVDQQDQAGTTAQAPTFQIMVQPDPVPEGASPLLPGQRLTARFAMPSRPLMQQWVLQLRQLLQRRFQV